MKNKKIRTPDTCERIDIHSYHTFVFLHLLWTKGQSRSSPYGFVNLLGGHLRNAPGENLVFLPFFPNVSMQHLGTDWWECLSGTPGLDGVWPPYPLQAR